MGLGDPTGSAGDRGDAAFGETPRIAEPRRGGETGADRLESANPVRRRIGVERAGVTDDLHGDFITQVFAREVVSDKAERPAGLKKGRRFAKIEGRGAI